MKYMNFNKFKEYWIAKSMTPEEFYKSASLTRKELVDVKNYIKALQDKNAPSSIIISHLQKFTPKLSEKWKAERAYYTEIKRTDTKIVAQAAEELGITKYRVILSPNACPECRKKTDNGVKKFTNQDMQKDGYGHVPPFHPNCYCVAIPE